MANFYASKEWVILLPPDVPDVKKATEDLSRCISLLAGITEGIVQKAPLVLDAHAPVPEGTTHTIVLASDGSGAERNGFYWRVSPERIEIHGESSRGLCNGIYSFLAALGISWPEIGQEILPSPQVANLRVFPFSSGSGIDEGIFEPSGYNGSDTAAAPWRRLVPAGLKEAKAILKKADVFVQWAARRRYDALIFPMSIFASRSGRKKLDELQCLAAEYGISLEAGGRELSSMVPRNMFLLHRDYFRMDGGHRKKDFHFCPTNPGAMNVIGKEGRRLFCSAPQVRVFHLWPDRGSGSLWCSCPTCRAFTPAEQNRIAVNAVADVLSGIRSDARITFFERSGENGNLPVRENLFRFEKLPDEREYR